MAYDVKNDFSDGDTFDANHANNIGDFCQDLEDNGLDASMAGLGNDCVDNAHIAANAVENEQLADDAVADEEIDWGGSNGTRPRAVVRGTDNATYVAQGMFHGTKSVSLTDTDTEQAATVTYSNAFMTDTGEPGFDGASPFFYATVEQDSFSGSETLMVKVDDITATSADITIYPEADPGTTTFGTTDSVIVHWMVFGDYTS